jgi:hypothetical protein
LSWLKAMKMENYRCKAGILGVAVLGITVLVFGASALAATPPSPVGLGTATNAAVLAGAGVTNTNTSTITGDLGSAPTPALVGTGNCPAAGCVVFLAGAAHPDDAVAIQQKSDADAARVHTQSLGGATAIGPQLGNTTAIDPGLYDVGTLTNITGTLHLNAASGPGSVWIFRAASSITAATGSTFSFDNVPTGTTVAALECNVFWTAVSSVSVGSGANFVGTVLAGTSITAASGAHVNGRLLAGTGDVTLDNNTIDRGSCTVVQAGTGGTPTGTGGGSGGNGGGPAGPSGGSGGTGTGTALGTGGAATTAFSAVPANAIAASPSSTGLAG